MFHKYTKYSNCNRSTPDRKFPNEKLVSAWKHSKMSSFCTVSHRECWLDSLWTLCSSIECNSFRNLASIRWPCDRVHCKQKKVRLNIRNHNNNFLNVNRDFTPIWCTTLSSWMRRHLQLALTNKRRIYHVFMCLILRSLTARLDAYIAATRLIAADARPGAAAASTRIRLAHCAEATVRFGRGVQAEQYIDRTQITFAMSRSTAFLDACFFCKNRKIYNETIQYGRGINL